MVVLAGMVAGMTMNAGWSIWIGVDARRSPRRCWSGLVNGVLIAYVGMPPFVVTLGMLSLARSLAMVLSDNKMVYEFGPDHAHAALARRRLDPRHPEPA